VFDLCLLIFFSNGEDGALTLVSCPGFKCN
jgi:hypothetical protein